jgi:hypothetical protein
MSLHSQAALFEARQLLELNHEIEKVKLLRSHSHAEHLKVVKELREILSILKATTQYPSEMTFDSKDPLSEFSIHGGDAATTSFTEHWLNSVPNFQVSFIIGTKKSRRALSTFSFHRLLGFSLLLR